MSACCERCVLSGRGLCDEMVTRPEESYRLWCVVVCDLEKITLVNEDEGLARQENIKLRNEQLHDLQSSNLMTVIWFGARGTEGGSLPSRESLKVRHSLEDLGLDGRMILKCILQQLDGMVGSGLIWLTV